MKPKRPGWYWFLPNEKCPTPTGLLNTERAVVVLVGQDTKTPTNPDALVVRFQQGAVRVRDLKGEWEAIPEPPKMQKLIRRRLRAKQTLP